MLINISQIIIPTRAREVDVESPEFLELKKSIKEHGLLVPLTVRRALTSERIKEGGSFSFDILLVCGARRLEALTQIFKETKNERVSNIPVNLIDIDNETEHLLCELEENIRRKDFTWQEQVLASGKLFEEIIKTDKTVDFKKFSLLLQQSEAKTSHDMDMYDNRFEHPTLFICETWSRAREELRRLKVAALVEEKINRDRKQNETPTTLKTDKQKGEGLSQQSVNPIPSALEMVHDSALHLLESLDDNSVDVICTDPPFFIEIQGSRHRRTQTKVYEEGQQDKKEDLLEILAPCIPHFARVLKPGAHLYMFFGIEHVALLRGILEQSNFKVHKIPLIWHRTASGAAANQPYYLPASAYQAIMFAFAPGERRRLQKQGVSNVITLPALPPQKKVHPLEIPVHVYADLIGRSACRGDIIIDPFCGTGNSLVAGLQCYCQVLGAEIRPDYRNLAVLNIEARLKFEENMRRSREDK